MSDHDNHIDALLEYLGLISIPESNRYHAALTALVAERDELKARCKAQHEVMTDMVGKQRNADRDRELRERDKAMERWMDQVTAMLCHSMTHSHDAKQELVTRCDAAIAAMQKEGGGA